MKAIETIIKVKTIKGTSFVGVRNYENKHGEVSNQTFVVGINYNNLLKADLETLKSFDVTTIDLEKFKANSSQPNKDKVTIELEEEKAKLLAKGDKTIVASVAQQNAYDSIAKGLKAKEGALYIYGLMVKKTKLKEGAYPTVKSQPLTLAKGLVKQYANLKGNKYKQFKLGQTEELKIQGVTI